MHVLLNRFPGGKHRALTLSYDDGRQADRRLVGIMDRHGIRGTFHLNSGSLGGSRHVGGSEVRSLYGAHEVSVHTVSHPRLEHLPREGVIQEILDDRRALEDLVGYPVRGMSFPFGSYAPGVVELLPALGIEYARTTESRGTFAVPTSLPLWHPTCRHRQDLLATGERFLEEAPRGRMMLLYVWGHSYEFDDDGNWDTMETFCARLGGRDDVWYATNIQIVDYLAAVRAVRFSASGTVAHNPSACSVWAERDGTPVEIRGGSTVDLARG